MMKQRAKQKAELDDPLCCCEYVDRHGGRSHIAACCCDCEDLDEACDRWMKREPQQTDSLSRVVATLTDRFRVPWILGAKKVDLSLIPPLILLPVFLHIAALHYLLGIVVLTALPVMVLWYYYFTHHKKGRTLFFLSLALFSLFYMYYLFLTEVVPQGDITDMQLGVVTVGVALTLAALVHTKKGPGYVRPGLSDLHSIVTYYSLPSDIDSAYHNGSRHQVLISNRTDSTYQDNETRDDPCDGIQNGCDKRNWCQNCKVVQPPRAGHCRICSTCVLRLDHHCVWINSCVGQANHRSFLLTLSFFLFTSLYGISLVLRSVCRTQNPLISLLYCPGVYTRFSSALCFTCAWYSSIVTAGLLHLLVMQLINVSCNVTEREARIALREKTGRSLFWGLVIHTGVYSRGFSGNWTEFLTMGEKVEPKALESAELV